ncbi:MAG: hypothetical protein ACP6IP_06205 [Candidatus Njordarchaeia archaeon]
MAEDLRERMMYPVGTVVAYVKYHIPIMRKLWYSISKKVSILRTSRFFIRHTGTCRFPGMATPTYTYKNFCYLSLGKSRILVMEAEQSDMKVIFDFRCFSTYSELRAVVYIPQIKQENYGHLTLELVKEKFKKLLNDLEIIDKTSIVAKTATVEVAKVIQPDFVPYYMSKLIPDPTKVESIKGKYAEFVVKMVNVQGYIHLKLIAEKVPIDKIGPVIEEGKRILQSNLDLND